MKYMNLNFNKLSFSEDHKKRLSEIMDECLPSVDIKFQITHQSNIRITRRFRRVRGSNMVYDTPITIPWFEFVLLHLPKYIKFLGISYITAGDIINIMHNKNTHPIDYLYGEYIKNYKN